MRCGRLFGSGLLATLTAGGLGALPARGAAPRSPAAWIAQALQAANAQRSAHETFRGVQADGSVVLFQTDAGQSKGIQRISYTKSHVTGHLTNLVMNRTAYFQGDSFSLINFFGFPALTAGHLAGRWVAAAHSNVAYSAIAADVTLSSSVHDLEVRGVLSASSTDLALTKPTHIDGVPVVGVAGIATAGNVTTHATLYVRAGGAPLPVEEIVVLSSGAQRSISTTTFSDWNEKVEVPKSTNPIPINRAATT